MSSAILRFFLFIFYFEMSILFNLVSLEHSGNHFSKGKKRSVNPVPKTLRLCISREQIPKRIAPIGRTRADVSPL